MDSVCTEQPVQITYIREYNKHKYIVLEKKLQNDCKLSKFQEKSTLNICFKAHTGKYASL